MRKPFLLILFLMGSLLLVNPASANTFGFDYISNNSGSADDLASQFILDVTAVGTDEDGNMRVGMHAQSIDGTLDDDGSDSFSTGTPVPEPATMLLLGVGLIGLAGFGRKRILKKK